MHFNVHLIGHKLKLNTILIHLIEHISMLYTLIYPLRLGPPHNGVTNFGEYCN
jgi:hypothetical protein